MRADAATDKGGNPVPPWQFASDDLTAGNVAKRPRHIGCAVTARSFGVDQAQNIAAARNDEIRGHQPDIAGRHGREGFCHGMMQARQNAGLDCMCSAERSTVRAAGIVLSRVSK